MSTVDTSGWSQDWESNAELEGVALDADAAIADAPKLIACLMAALKGDEAGIAAAISGKADDADVVHIAGDETISGGKTFSAAITTANNLFLKARRSGASRGTNPSSQVAWILSLEDGSGTRIGALDMRLNTNGNVVTNFYAYKNTAATAYAGLSITYPASGDPYARAPSTPASGAAQDVVTRDFLAGDDRLARTGAANAFSVADAAHRDGDASYLALSGGSAEGEGASLELSGPSRASGAGGFALSASDGADSAALEGLPDGTLEWAGQPLQTTSDARRKTELAAVPDAVLDAWGDVHWGQFQFLDALERKGADARLHAGIVAQAVLAAFEARGLDACAYGVLCHVERPARDWTEEVVEREARTEAVLSTGPDGEPVETVQEIPAVVRTVQRHEDAVDLWTVRYAEAQALEAAFQRRRADRLEARIAALEAALAGGAS